MYVYILMSFAYVSIYVLHLLLLSICNICIQFVYINMSHETDQAYFEYFLSSMIILSFRLTQRFGRRFLKQQGFSNSYACCLFRRSPF